MTATKLLSDNGVSSGISGYQLTGGNDGTLQLQTTTSGGTATTAVTIDTSQNVGIGTSSTSTTAASSCLFLGIGNSGASYNSTLRLGGYSTTAQLRYTFNHAGAGYGWGIGSSGSDAFIIGTVQDGATGQVASEKMRIDSSGNLGVGLTSIPNAQGNSIAVGNTSGANINITSNSTPGTVASPKYLDLRFLGYANAEMAKIRSWDESSNTGYGNLTFWTGVSGATSERARITAAGEMLVGCTTLPTSTVTNAGVGIFNESGTGGRIQLGKTVSGTQNGIANYYNGTYVGGITYTNTATALVASSDERLKENIVSAPAAIEKAMAIEVVSYDWKHDPTHVEYGLVAQRLNAVYPEAVNVGDDGEEIETTWGVEYGRLTPLLLKAIQEQQALIEQLRADVAALKAKA